MALASDCNEARPGLMDATPRGAGRPLFSAGEAQNLLGTKLPASRGWGRRQPTKGGGAIRNKTAIRHPPSATQPPGKTSSRHQAESNKTQTWSEIDEADEANEVCEVPTTSLPPSQSL